MISQELIAYVKSELSKGKSREAIRSTLTSGGGWSEMDIGEVFRELIPFEKPIEKIVEKPLEKPIEKIIEKPVEKPLELMKPKVAPMLASFKVEKSLVHIRFMRGVLVFLLIVFCAGFLYLYSGNLIPFLKKSAPAVTPDVVSTIQELPVAPVVTVVDCGTSKSPDFKKIDSYMKNDVFKCLGENLASCTNAEATLTDSLLPDLFKVIKKGEKCYIELSYNVNNTLVDIKGVKLAGRSMSCPVEGIKMMDNSNTNKLVFIPATKDNPNKYAFDAYFYDSLGIFIDNNFSQTKIESLVCSGDYISSVVDSHTLQK